MAPGVLALVVPDVIQINKPATPPSWGVQKRRLTCHLLQRMTEQYVAVQTPPPELRVVPALRTEILT